MNNAGPPPAEVKVFPGTYAESVNLGLMGSAIAGGPGDITLRTVNAAGVSTPSTVDVMPASGPAFTSSVSPYPGNITLIGFIVQSPDSSGIGLPIVQGNVTLQDITADGNAGNGFSAGTASGDVQIHRSSFSDNTGGDGIGFGTVVNVSFDRVIADRNNGDGASFGLTGAVRVTDSSFSDNENGSGLSFGTATEAVFDGVDANRNNGSGASFGVNSDVRITDSNFNENKDGGGLSFGTATSLVLDDVNANRNSEFGASFGVNGGVRITGSHFNDNEGDNGLSFGTATEVVFDRVTANGNNGSGASFGVGGDVSITSSSFNDAKDGDGLSFGTAAHLRVALVTASGNSENGLAARAARANITTSSFESNKESGVTLNVVAGGGLISLTCNDIAGNAAGLVLGEDAGNVVAQSNFWGDPSGPTHPTNPGGVGDSIEDAANGGAGNALFTPFLRASASASGSCLKQAPALGAKPIGFLVLALFLLPAWRLARRRSSVPGAHVHS